MDLCSAWPDVSEEDVLAIGALTDWLGLEVNIASTSEGVGDNQRWGGKIVGSSLWMDSTLEVPVSGQNGGGNQVVVDDGVLDLIRNLTRVTNACHASVTSNVETERIKGILNTSVAEVLLNDT